MRLVLSVLLLVAGLSSADAQSGRIDRFDRIKAGIMKYESLSSTVNDNISTGKIVRGQGIKIVDVTRNIPAKDGTLFGVEVAVVGGPKGSKAPVKILWRYPQPGLKSPTTGTTKFTDEYVDTVTIGNTFEFHWSLGAEWTLVPGTWTLEVSQDDRKLLVQDFVLTKP